MMYAYRNRSKAIRRQVPLNQGARGMLTRSDGGHNTGEDRICCGVAPARRGGLDQSAAPIARWPTGRTRCSDLGHHLGPEEPGELTGDGGSHHRAHVLMGGQLSDRLDRRTCAAQERATVSGDTPFWRSLMPTPTFGLCW